MYKTASRNTQARIERIVMKDMPSTESPITDEDRRKFLNDKLHAIEMQLIAMPRKNPERKKLGQQKFLLQTQITALRKGPKDRQALGQCFIEVANRLLPLETYTKIMEEAKHVHDIRYKAVIDRGKEQQAIIAERHLAAMSNDSTDGAPHD